MSMNIHFRGVREIKIVALNDKIEEQIEWYTEQWQTPTNVSYEIERSPDPIKAYEEHVLSIGRDEYVPLYDPKDIFHEGPIIGRTKINHAKLHIEEFREWCNMMRNAGFKIEGIVL